MALFGFSLTPRRRGDKELHTALVGLANQLKLVLHNQEIIMGQVDTSALTAAIARLQATDTAVLAAFQTMRDAAKQSADQIASLSQQLSDALANNDPNAVAALQGQLNDAASSLNKVADDITGAVQSNAAVPDLPPAPAPDPSAASSS